MRAVFLTLPVAWAMACTTGGQGDIISKWHVLQGATQLTCENWPRRDRDLQIDDIGVIKGGTPGFLVSGLRRDGQPLQYFTPFDNDVKIDPDRRVELTFGRGAILAGGISPKSGVIDAVVVRGVGADPQVETRVELRAIPSNLLVAQASLGASSVSEATVHRSGQGAYVVLKTDGHQFRLAYVDLSKPARPRVTAVAGFASGERPVLAVDPNRRGGWAVWREGDSQGSLRAMALEGERSISSVMTLDLQVSGDIEAFSAYNGGDQLLVAWIEGDSLVGQAELKVALLQRTPKGNQGLKRRWLRTVALRDVHASDPVFLRTAEGPEVAMLNWIDEESTLARFAIGPSSLGRPTYTGIFPRGARVLDTFPENAAATDSYVLIRYREGEQWRHRLCEL